ncbi:recombinase family protein [Streptomyces sp. NPDC048349]|uniref:recombinase family protein n=1 Tax=Streptomyces sp. NPDC048349 TaxID=3155486 RepID=UPI00342A9CD0
MEHALTALTQVQFGDWTDRNNAEQRRVSLDARPAGRSDPLERLRALRTGGVRRAGERAGYNGRMLRVVCYVQAPRQEADAQLELLELMAKARHWIVRDERCLDSAGPALLEYRPGLSAARRLLRAGYADGLLVPRYEHVSPNLAEYERLLLEMDQRGWFMALALSETGR